MVAWNALYKPPTHSGNVGGMDLPDEFGTEPLLGYRAWQVVDAGDGGGPALKSLHVSYIWGRQIEAVCHIPPAMYFKGRHEGRPSPDLACSCGIYAQLPEHPLTEWDTAKRARVSASGTIAMWGRIIQCERGYKAQYAEIQEPLVIDVSCIAGCERPPVRVALPELSQIAYPAYCAEHLKTSREFVTIHASLWLSEICERLSERYDLEVLTWT
jgi:hypothetical protein